jgi:S1-C subfamily serine protease
MKYLLLLLLFPSLAIGQSLSTDRVSRLSKAVVKINTEGSTEMGTGFFFSEIGYPLTCWHVIQSAVVTDSNSKILELKKIFAT